MSLSRELKSYYEERFSMMASQGWKDLMEDVEAMVDDTNKLDGATKKNLKFKKGELSIMRWILTLKEVSTKIYDDLKADDLT